MLNFTALGGLHTVQGLDIKNIVNLFGVIVLSKDSSNLSYCIQVQMT
jgi:hypothetical protein